MGGVSQPPCFWSSTIYHSEFKAACLETWVVQEKQPAKNEALAFNVGFSKPRRWHSMWVSVSFLCLAGDPRDQDNTGVPLCQSPESVCEKISKSVF